MKQIDMDSILEEKHRILRMNPSFESQDPADSQFPLSGKVYKIYFYSFMEEEQYMFSIHEKIKRNGWFTF